MSSVERRVWRLAVPLREPFITATGVVTQRELFLLTLEEDGACGIGEAAPLPEHDGSDPRQALEALTTRRGLRPPAARACEEIARLDLEARREGRTLCRLGSDAVPVNVTLAAGPPAEVAEHARRALEAGFSTFKLKVGLPDDSERVAAVRHAVGSWPALRVDANGRWSVEQAVAAIRALERFDLELVEQPCATLEELREVRSRVSVAIAADESIRDAADVERAAALEACDAVCIKLQRAGGIGPARAAIERARERGLEPYLASMLEGPWGIAAALQLASEQQLRLACGLATLSLLDGPVTELLGAPEGGVLAVPDGPGLGVPCDAGTLARLGAEVLAVTKLGRRGQRSGRSL